MKPFVFIFALYLIPLSPYSVPPNLSGLQLALEGIVLALLLHLDLHYSHIDFSLSKLSYGLLSKACRTWFCGRVVLARTLCTTEMSELLSDSETFSCASRRIFIMRFGFRSLPLMANRRLQYEQISNPAMLVLASSHAFLAFQPPF